MELINARHTIVVCAEIAFLLIALAACGDDGSDFAARPDGTVPASSASTTNASFGTMTDERDAEGKLLPDEKRLTKVGRFVRSTSIDELPQLLNVFKGDMSLIGPRPLLPKYLPLYSPEQARRHEVRPGISGWAQCHGRNNITWTEKFKLDVWYVDHCTLWTDIKIIWITVMKVLKRADINKDGEATTVAFNGHN